MGHRKQTHTQPVAGTLKGWAAIADYLKMPVATAQRWVKGGMPVRHEGRYTVADADELRAWLGREAAMYRRRVESASACGGPWRSIISSFF